MRLRPALAAAVACCVVWWPGASAAAACGYGPSDGPPRWSPDGQLIAFTSAREGNPYDCARPIWELAASNRLYVVRADAAGLRAIAGPGLSRGFAWLPDASGLVWSTDNQQGGRFQLEAVSLDGGPARPLTEDAVVKGAPSPSPDGRQVAFDAYGESTGYVRLIRLIGLDGANETTITRAGIAPQWSPDGERIAFLGEGVRVVAAAGGESRRLSERAPDYEHLSWSPDGQRLAFSSAGDLYTVDLAGRETRLVDDDVVMPVWSPVGDLLAFVRRGEVFVVGSEGGEPVQLTRHVRASGAPSWRPDGEAMAVTAAGECGRSGITVVHLADRSAHRITNRCDLYGTAEADRLTGSPGRDVVFARAGDDVVAAGRGSDEVLAGPGNDHVLAGRGNDLVVGGPGSDSLDGGREDDVLLGGPGRDELHGGSGQDRLLARDGHRDRLTCGRGVDVAVADRFDRIASDCEEVRLDRQATS